MVPVGWLAESFLSHIGPKGTLGKRRPSIRHLIELGVEGEGIFQHGIRAGRCLPAPPIELSWSLAQVARAGGVLQT